MIQEIKRLKDSNMDLTQTIENFKNKENSNMFPKIIGEKEKVKRKENKSLCWIVFPVNYML